MDPTVAPFWTIFVSRAAARSHSRGVCVSSCFFGRACVITPVVLILRPASSCHLDLGHSSDSDSPIGFDHSLQFDRSCNFNGHRSTGAYHHQRSILSPCSHLSSRLVDKAEKRGSELSFVFRRYEVTGVLNHHGGGGVGVCHSKTLITSNVIPMRYPRPLIRTERMPKGVIPN